MTIIIIVCGALGGVIVFVLLVLIICYCAWRRRNRTWKADFVTVNRSADYKPRSSGDIELGEAKWNQSHSSGKGVCALVLVYVCMWCACVHVCIRV